jgi:hypothetical protein
MMSAALLMLAGVKQTGKAVGSADSSIDQGKPEGMSFAKSFNDRVSESTLLQGKDIAKEVSIRLPPPGSKVAAPAKNLDSVIATPGEGKELAHAVQEITANGKAKNVASILGVAAPAAAVTESVAQATANDSAAKNIAPEISVKNDEPSEDASPSLSASSALPVVLQPNDGVVASASSTEEGRPIVSSAGSAFVQKEPESAGKTKEISSARKTAKISENTPTSKAAQKTVGIDGNLVSKPVEASSREDAGPSPQGIVTGEVASPKDDFRPTGDPIGQAIPGVAVASPGVPSAVAGAVIHQETGHEVTARAVDTEIAMSSPDSQPALPRFGGELEKAATASVPAGNGSDNKTQSAFAPATMVHSAVGSTASGTAPIAVVSGSTPGEPAPTKVQIGDLGVHTSGLSAGSREQGGLSMAATPTDAIPTMLKATPTTLEVGIQDGTHGWLKVRAEMADGGVVNASVSAASSTGQEMLHRELPAITAYLQQEKVAVNAIAVHTPLATGAEQRSSTGMDGAGGQTPQGGHEGSEPQQNIRKGMPAGPDEAMIYQSLHGVDEDGSLSLAAYASGGSWLSVRA